MLVLSRQPGERIHLGSNVVISILSVKGSRARIGIHAPSEIAVYREEIRPPHSQDFSTVLAPSPPTLPR